MTETIRLQSRAHRLYAIDKIAEAPVGWIVTIKEETRRDAQNRLFWEIMGDLAKAEPDGRKWTKETWRDAIMHARGHQVQFAQALDGSGPFPVGFRSSHLSVSQMSEVIEYAFSYGAERGVVFTIDRRRAAELFGVAA
jgi:hypothetical protein